MKLMTKEIAKKLPPLGTESDIAVVKYFSPVSSWTWFASEYDPKSGDMFGLVFGHYKEFGYFNLHELEQVTLPFGMKIERDLSWEPTTFKEIYPEFYK